MSKLPAFQFYPGDWRKDPGVQSLSYHDRGVWFEILLLMHESDERGKLNLNGKPMPVDALARLLGLDNQNLTTTLTCLLEFGVASRCEETGSLVCRRMLRDEKLRNIRKECGKLGGNPNLVKQKRTTRVKQKPTPSSSTSVEDESVSSERKKRKCSSAATGDSDPKFEEFWTIYPVRKAKGKARAAWAKAIKKADPEVILEAAEIFQSMSRGKDQQYLPHPTTWLNGECWTDETAKKKDPFAYLSLPDDELEAFVKAELAK